MLACQGFSSVSERHFVLLKTPSLLPTEADDQDTSVFGGTSNEVRACLGRKAFSKGRFDAEWQHACVHRARLVDGVASALWCARHVAVTCTPSGWRQTLAPAHIVATRHRPGYACRTTARTVCNLIALRTKLATPAMRLNLFYANVRTKGRTCCL